MNNTNIETLTEGMSEKVKRKSYVDSFFYNQSGRSGENLMKKHDQMLINFILKADRIDKKSPMFRGVAEDIKRQQTSSILYTILMMDNVNLCYSSVELPPAFKVFDGKDIKTTNDRAIFIDVSKLVIEKNGYYVCKNPAKLVSYLLAALYYLTYRKDINKVVNNSAITISGCECYTSMFLYVLDYLRIIGYSANKDKIGYFVALFYLNNMLGKELDTYTKNLAAKISGVPQGTVHALDLYITDGMFNSIDTFVTILADTFKLKGFTTEVFIQKWIFLFGNGTQYASELFTSFAVILGYTFCGAYIVNQKQIEKCCGQSMVKFCNSMMMAGSEMFDRRVYMSESELESLKKRDKSTEALAESVRLSKINTNPEMIKFVKEDFASTCSIDKKISDNIDHYLAIFDGQEKLDTVFETATKMALVAMDATCNGSTDFMYESGVLTSLLSKGNKFLTESTKNKILNNINGREETYLEQMREYRTSDNAKSKRYSKALTELRDCKSYL